ncbi:hypothetical protein DPMN_031548 [Dreissena polymorpha]|uniref:Uncharacterized protein n=1 Tax=Dreissena polymorpha TaxID=45954 RepID=A0A9D4M2I9_DREPO|nr:hypothetical protein DPMN_031548 [Dreissena polymorpha]
MADQIVSNRLDRGDIPWLQSTNNFLSGGVPQTQGYGWAVFSCVAIECVRFYIKEAFLEKIESEPYLSTMRQVKGLQDQELLKILSEDKHLVGAYVEHVLVREALAAIFVAFTGDTYTNANVECCSIIHRSTLRAMQAACAIGEAKKNELLNRYKHISGKC